MKATSVEEVETFKDIPNIGPAMIRTFQLVNVTEPDDLKKRDPYALYTKLCKTTGKRYDPCVLDVFMAAVDFMNGAPPHPWWHYTKERKKSYPDI
jgi:hypothetical protein